MIIPDTVALAAAGTAAAQVNIGNFVVAEWADILLGIRPALCDTVLTTAEHSMWTWQLTSNEVKGFLPMDGPGVTHGVGTITNACVTGMEFEYYPLNIVPIYGGETITYQTTLEVVVSGNAMAWCTVWYGQAAAGDIMPSRLDEFPNTQNYYMMSDEQAAVAGARSAANNFVLVGMEEIVELYGTLASVAIVAGDSYNGIYEMICSGFTSSPIQYGSHAAPPMLGAAAGGMGQGNVKLSREHVRMPTDRYCSIDAYITVNATVPATADWEVGVRAHRPAGE